MIHSWWTMNVLSLLQLHKQVEMSRQWVKLTRFLLGNSAVVSVYFSDTLRTLLAGSHPELSQYYPEWPLARKAGEGKVLNLLQLTGAFFHWVYMWMTELHNATIAPAAHLQRKTPGKIMLLWTKAAECTV